MAMTGDTSSLMCRKRSINREISRVGTYPGLGLDLAQTHQEPNTKYFSSKQNGGGGRCAGKRHARCLRI